MDEPYGACCTAGRGWPFDATLARQWMGGGRPSTCHSNNISFTPLISLFCGLDNVLWKGETIKAKIAQFRDMSIMYHAFMFKHTFCLISSVVHVRMIIQFPANHWNPHPPILNRVEIIKEMVYEYHVSSSVLMTSTIGRIYWLSRIFRSMIIVIA